MSRCWLSNRIANIASGLAVLFLVTMGGSEVRAQSEPRVGGMALSAYVGTIPYQERLLTYVVGYETWIGPCPDPEPIERLNVLLPQRSVALPGDPDPDAPQWIEHIRITGCTNAFERHVYVSMKGDTPVFHARLIGTSRTSPALEDEAVAAVRESEHRAAVAAGCPDTQPLRVFTATYREQFDTEYGPGWSETWMISDCKGPRDITVTFTPDHSGGTRFEFAAPTQ